MSYREKIAFLYLFGIGLCFGAYFVYLTLNPNFYELPFLKQFIPLSIAGVSNMVIVGIGHLWLFRTSDPVERIANDERDLKIDATSTTSAYHVLIYSVLLVGGVLPFYASGWKIVNCIIFAVFIAEVVRNGSVLFKYRKQK